MAATSSKKVVYAALFGNGAIAIIKFIASFITGSSAMLSEAIHSVVDTSNQGILLYGMGRSQRPPDEKHPFGYGMELYFWAFVVAILIFAAGAGFSIYEGVQKLIHPHPIKSPMINYVVLILAMIFEGFAWAIAYKAFQETRGKKSFISAVRQSKDPTVFTVLFEDTAAMLGLMIAFVGILLSQIFGWAWMDGLASVLIGVVLATTAALLAYESKGLLIGEAASGEIVADIRQFVAGQSQVLTVNEVLTLHLGPNDVLLNLSVDFATGISADNVESLISDMEVEIKQRYPEITRIFIEAQSLTDHFRAQKALEA